MKKLNLHKETLVELTPDDLRGVVGADASESQSCPITYSCVSCGECNIGVSNHCQINITNRCTIGGGFCG